jgi:putative ABC transport system permease protein
MFFVTYLRRELRRRMRQAIFIALGLALGVGLVVTVTAASAGVKKAESGVLSALYGVGTDVTVTGAAPGPPKPGSTSKNNQNDQNDQNDQNNYGIEPGPNGQPEICTSNGKCTSAAGKTIDQLTASYSGISESKVAEAARLHAVTAAAGGITLTDNTTTFGHSSSSLPQPSSFTLDGVDTSKPSLGPLSSASLAFGHSFTAADADTDFAVVDSGYAKSKNLKVGSVLTIGQMKFTVIGIVRQPQASSPPDVYVPLARAQAMSLYAGSLNGDVNEIYVAAASAADIPAVSKEISRLLPGTTVTTEASLASEVTGSVSSAAKLAGDLGRWLAVLVLVSAFAVASLLTMAAVARRVAEFGTLKALGWRTRRIVAQVLGESVAMGIAGAAAGVGLGFAGAAIISAVAPTLSATVPGSSGAFSLAAGQAVGPGPAGGVPHSPGSTTSHVVAVPLHPSVTVAVIVLAVILAVAGGLLAGSLGSWRIARLRPADALSRVA